MSNKIVQLNNNTNNLSGVVSFISEQSTSEINKSILNSNENPIILSINNDKTIANNISSNLLLSKIYGTSYYNSMLNIIGENNIDYFISVKENSFNFLPKTNCNKDIIKRTGGCTYYWNNIIPYVNDEYAKWSNLIINQGNTISGYYWQTIGKNTNFISSGNIDISNDELGLISSTTNFYNYFPYLNNQKINLNIKKNISSLNIDSIGKGELSINDNYNTKFNFNNTNVILNSNASGIININASICNILSGNYNQINMNNSRLYINANNIINENYDNISSMNSYINISKINNSDKGILNNQYNANANVYEFDDLSGNNYSNGTTLVSCSTISNIGINNTRNKTLIGHSHNNIFNWNSNGNVTNGIYVANEYDNNNTIQNEISNTNYNAIPFDNIRHLQFVNLPIGSIVGWFQFKNNNKWFPNVPYGFYNISEDDSDPAVKFETKINEETEEEINICKIYIDIDDPKSNSYNLDFCRLYGDSNNEYLSNGYIVINNYINKIKISQTNNSRIIMIVKYNNYVMPKE